jgi:hypothetical protein
VAPEMSRTVWSRGAIAGAGRIQHVCACVIFAHYTSEVAGARGVTHATCDCE